MGEENMVNHWLAFNTYAQKWHNIFVYTELAKASHVAKPALEFDRAEMGM